MRNHIDPPIIRHGQRIRRILVAALLICLTATAAAAAGPAQVIDDFLAAYRAGDVDKMTAIYAEDVRFVDVSQRHELTGREAMRDSLGNLRTIHKEMGVEVKRRAVSGSLVTVEVVYTGTLDSDALGQPEEEDLVYSLPAVLLFEVENGRIASQTDYLDFRTFSEKFAAFMPPPASH